MQRFTLSTAAVLVTGSLLLISSASAFADDKASAEEAKEPTELKLGGLTMSAPAAWKQVKPRSRIVKYELHAPPAKGDKTQGRLTVTAAGGSVEQNVERWYTQFVQPDGKSTKEVAKLDKTKIDGKAVHFVDISGTYKDKPFPFSPDVTLREKYRMLAAIIETKGASIFVKFYGPEKTIAEHEKAFRKMIHGLK